MPRRPLVQQPVVTLTTDFGLTDSYVAEMKGVLLSQCPAARLIDVTHLIPPQDVLTGSIILDRVVRTFAPGSVHLVVVDPGVGGDRKLLVAELNKQLIVCPDNGLITWPWRRQGSGRAMELTWRPRDVSATFHGRDIMAPVAGMLAQDRRRLPKLARQRILPHLLDLHPAEAGAVRGTVIQIDHFGNATTNMILDWRRPPTRVVVRRKSIGPLRRTYGEVAAGSALALVGSSGLLEIAVRNGSAQRVLGLRIGDPVTLQYALNPK